ncbi:hypothetical protein DNHGIG_00390 [Collibacillus ludicampi]|uniref:Phage protein n=1 Tax=Collibacillus ludicampi TaxID=2771369 RepID=A0AAV4L9P2_9BACL|nr:hypothetical protein [Collibacillus ludicampi]GIM44490.1 hypothetical protein DNHGIG_00390 [Collibacillus ludicampi]
MVRKRKNPVYKIIEIPDTGCGRTLDDLLNSKEVHDWFRRVIAYGKMLKSRSKDGKINTETYQSSE